MRLLFPALISLAMFSMTSSSQAACTPFTGSCGNSGQISCQAANAPYYACLKALKTGANCANCASPDDSAANTSGDSRSNPYPSNDRYDHDHHDRHSDNGGYDQNSGR